ncbi:hypothetical protein SLEP1_g16753 [Rubroshorea leprosula]|uniref:Uncharacterized protein n=1 Tax=Rubroshorea leprosula TaxID=152421 RepID=A0AAV5J146_9ROSI|nr:hypothetical protein SLEP1_g16753 [Rubroshorea leprosula]
MQGTNCTQPTSSWRLLSAIIKYLWSTTILTIQTTASVAGTYEPEQNNSAREPVPPLHMDLSLSVDVSLPPLRSVNLSVLRLRPLLVLV